MRSYDFTATEKQDRIMAELAELRNEITIVRRFVERISSSCSRLLREISQEDRTKIKPAASVMSFRHRERLNAGRQRAKERGTKFGRPPTLTDEQKREALSRRDNGETVYEVARVFGVSASTISRLG